MRVCRFGFDEMVLTGFYADEHVIPLDQAAEAYSRDTGVELCCQPPRTFSTSCRPTALLTKQPASCTPGSSSSASSSVTS